MHELIDLSDFRSVFTAFTHGKSITNCSYYIITQKHASTCEQKFWLSMWQTSGILRIVFFSLLLANNKISYNHFEKLTCSFQSFSVRSAPLQMRHTVTVNRPHSIYNKCFNVSLRINYTIYFIEAIFVHLKWQNGNNRPKKGIPLNEKYIHHSNKLGSECEWDGTGKLLLVIYRTNVSYWLCSLVYNK